MSGKEYTTELLKLEDAQIERMEEAEEEMILQISLKRKMHTCPRGKAKTDQVHDYRIRTVRDQSIRRKLLKLLHRRWSTKDIAKDTHTSVSGVSRCLALYPQGKPTRCPGCFPLMNSKATQTVKDFNGS